ncbi:ribosomal protein L16 [Tanacetum coccineum]
MNKPAAAQEVMIRTGAANIHQEEGYTKEVDKKKTELQTKLVEVYEASATEINEEEQRIKHRKGRVEGIRDGGNNICFGKYALQALEPARITSRQIEVGRKALQLNVRRSGAKGGKVFVACFWHGTAVYDKTE